MRKRIGCVLIIFLCFLLTACGETGPVVSSGQKTTERPGVKLDTDPCSVLTAQEVEQVLGITMTAHNDKELDSSVAGEFRFTSCSYHSKNDSDAYASMLLSIYTDPSLATSSFQTLKSENSNSKSIDGLGDEAYTQPDEQPADLYVLKGNVRLTVYEAYHHLTALDREKQLAQLALKHL